ncbi:HlyC/CorC family protein [Rickettsiales endosymbiont of Paramecium tredecaurelia]|uniref:HlyC/CorC family transporter n=1 Tax=Candidatus Sarmatiella mevalonica TaxID=2770581 RepID=UPI001924C405|nr:CNNM domain-containing protein [Candidatus Sarmatiella mevalonica]MBL3284540.1 HlyC/CorC family protein [Candidatus Sarmatiella mevalonica]
MIIFLILCTLFLLIISAMLAASETAVGIATSSKVYKLKNDKINKKILLILEILKVRQKVISASLIGNNIINTICTTLATSVFITFLGDDAGTVVASVVMACIITAFVEYVPKRIALTNPEYILSLTVFVLVPALKIFALVDFALDVIFRIFCVIFRIKINHKSSVSDEVREILEHHHYEGNVNKFDKDMLDGVLDIKDLSVSDIMLHRSKIFAVNIDLPNQDIVKSILSQKHTRIPLWKDARENIVGVLHTRDLSAAIMQSANNYDKINIHALVTKPWFIPDNVSVLDQLNAFRERKNHFACIVDEYGVLLGILTLEDILEQIVGRIYDEHDSSVRSVYRKSEHEFVIDGEAKIRDLNRELDWSLSDEDASTIAGLIINEAERIPDQGDVVEILDIRFTILKKDGNRIKKVRANIVQDSEE